MKTFRCLIAVLFVMFMPYNAIAQDAEINVDAEQEKAPAYIEYTEETHGSLHVNYPQVINLADTIVEQKINAEIKQKINLDSYIAMAEQGGGTEITCKACILNSQGVPYIISVLVTTEGRLISGRRGHEYTPLMFWASDGEIIDSNILFNSSAQEKIDAWAEEELANMSYYDISEAFPVPLERSVLTKTGITISYPQGSFKFLSDRSAAFSFYYYEIKDMLNLSDGSPVLKLDVFNSDSFDADKDNLALGKLPNVPDILGRPIEEVLEQYKELTDPERYVSAERYVLEAPEFRNIYPIVNDGQTSVSAILAKRMALAGCEIGYTTKPDIVKTFGEPLAVLPLEGAAAEQYFVPEGEGLMYTFGDFSIMIALDKQDIFSAILIQKEEA